MNFCHYNSCLLIKEKRILKKKGIKKAVFLNPLMLIPLPFDGNKMEGVTKNVVNLPNAFYWLLPFWHKG